MLGPYRLDHRLGEGGMGEVFRATDARLERTVAIKLLRGHSPDDPVSRERFQREAQAASSLNHPHICTVYDVGESAGQPFLVMEHLEGETLRARLSTKRRMKSRPRSPERRLIKAGWFTPLARCCGSRSRIAPERKRTLPRRSNGEKGFGHFHHTAYSIGAIYAQLGDFDRAQQWIERAANDGFPCYSMFETDPFLARLRETPHFRTFLANLRAEWESLPDE